MRLFHTSFNLSPRVELFTPRIPAQRLDGEDSQTKRICCASHLTGCLRSSPETASFFELNPYDKERGLKARISLEFAFLHQERVSFYHGIPFIAYEFDVPRSIVRDPTQLLGLVPDIQHTQEHWIMENVSPVSSQIYLLHHALIQDSLWTYEFLPITEEDFSRLKPVIPFDYERSILS